MALDDALFDGDVISAYRQKVVSSLNLAEKASTLFFFFIDILLFTPSAHKAFL